MNISDTMILSKSRKENAKTAPFTDITNGIVSWLLTSMETPLTKLQMLCLERFLGTFKTIIKV